MCFPDDHHKLELRGKPKGMKIVLQERKSVWDKYTVLCNEHSMMVVRKYTPYTKSQSHKDAEHRIMLAEAAGQEGAPSAEDVIDAHGAPSVAPPPLQTTSGAAWSVSSRCRRTSEQRNPLFNRSSKTRATFACFFQNFIVN